MKKKKVLFLFFILIVFLLASCTAKNETVDLVNKDKKITVAAASDLRFAFEEIGNLFEEKTEIKTVFQFGSSGNLAHQIANGAPIDLYASANKKFVEELFENGDIIEETMELYAIGRIVLAVNKNANLNVVNLEDLLSNEIDHISIANPSHAPYGLAAKEALESAGLWDLVEEKLVYGENVSQAMQFIETGNASVGIIALSIANADAIEYTLIDDNLHNPLEQMLGVVSHSNNKELAKEFASFVNGPIGRPVMEKYGFHLP
jgi:molybdate transport system substrate-binding protein